MPLQLPVTVPPAATLVGVTLKVVGGTTADESVKASALAVAVRTCTFMPYALSMYVCPTNSAASPKLLGVPSVMSRTSVSSPPQFVHGNWNGSATRIWAPLFG